MWFDSLTQNSHHWVHPHHAVEFTPAPSQNILICYTENSRGLVLSKPDYFDLLHNTKLTSFRALKVPPQLSSLTSPLPVTAWRLSEVGSQPSSVVSQQSWFWAFLFHMIYFPIPPPPPQPARWHSHLLRAPLSNAPAKSEVLRWVIYGRKVVHYGASTWNSCEKLGNSHILHGNPMEFWRNLWDSNTRKSRVHAPCVCVVFLTYDGEGGPPLIQALEKENSFFFLGGGGTKTNVLLLVREWNTILS